MAYNYQQFLISIERSLPRTPTTTEIFGMKALEAIPRLIDSRQRMRASVLQNNLQATLTREDPGTVAEYNGLVSSFERSLSTLDAMNPYVGQLKSQFRGQAELFIAQKEVKQQEQLTGYSIDSMLSAYNKRALGAEATVEDYFNLVPKQVRESKSFQRRMPFIEQALKMGDVGLAASNRQLIADAEARASVQNFSLGQSLSPSRDVDDYRARFAQSTATLSADARSTRTYITAASDVGANAVLNVQANRSKLTEKNAKAFLSNLKSGMRNEYATSKQKTPEEKQALLNKYDAGIPKEHKGTSYYKDVYQPDVQAMLAEEPGEAKILAEDPEPPTIADNLKRTEQQFTASVVANPPDSEAEFKERQRFYYRNLDPLKPQMLLDLDKKSAVEIAEGAGISIEEARLIKKTIEEGVARSAWEEAKEEEKISQRQQENLALLQAYGGVVQGYLNKLASVEAPYTLVEQIALEAERESREAFSEVKGATDDEKKMFNQAIVEGTRSLFDYAASTVRIPQELDGYLARYSGHMSQRGIENAVRLRAELYEMQNAGGLTYLNTQTQRILDLMDSGIDLSFLEGTEEGQAISLAMNIGIDRLSPEQIEEKKKLAPQNQTWINLLDNRISNFKKQAEQDPLLFAQARGIPTVGTAPINLEQPLEPQLEARVMFIDKLRGYYGRTQHIPIFSKAEKAAMQQLFKEAPIAQMDASLKMVLGETETTINIVPDDFADVFGKTNVDAVWNQQYMPSDTQRLFSRRAQESAVEARHLTAVKNAMVNILGSSSSYAANQTFNDELAGAITQGLLGNEGIPLRSTEEHGFEQLPALVKNIENYFTAITAGDTKILLPKREEKIFAPGISGVLEASLLGSIDLNKATIKDQIQAQNIYYKHFDLESQTWSTRQFPDLLTLASSNWRLSALDLGTYKILVADPRTGSMVEALDEFGKPRIVKLQ